MKDPCVILLLEDEPLILMDLEFAAEDCGCTGLAATGLDEAFVHLEGRDDINVAVLDVTLRGGDNCVPVADELDKRGIPYLLHSGDLNRHDETVRTLGVRHIPKPADARFVIETAKAYMTDQNGAPAA